MEVDEAGDAAVIAHTAADDYTAAAAVTVADTAADTAAAPADGGEGGGGCVGGDEFAALREKVLAGQTSSREVVDAVLNLLVGGQFDLEANFVVRDPEGVSGLVCLLDVCDPQCRGEILSLFTAVLRKSLRNLQACTEAGLIGQLLQRLQKLDDVTAELLVGVVGVLASYSITVRELKLLFGCLRGEKCRWRRHAVKLLSVLNHMPQRHGPETFFSFPGGSGSAIALPPIARWPYQNGFTVHMWVRMDPVTSLNAEKEKPYLYCFRTSKGVGYSSHFMGSCLTVTALKSKGKGSQHCIQYDFQPKKWYMITIVHVYNRWKNCEIRCYVDGNLVSSGDMAWYISTNDTFDKCYLGSADNIDADRTFSGQMSAVYLFSEALNGSHVAAIFQLGPGYKNTFKFETESDLHLPEHHQLVLYEGRLAGSLAFTYNAKATDGQLCLESSPRDTTSIFVHTPHALMLQCVKAVVTNPIHSAMHSIGGVQVLFPLFGQLDFLEHNSEEMNTSVCGTLLAFLLDLLKSSVIMQEQMVSSKGFLLIGAHLEKASTQHLTLSVVGHLLSFTKYLESIPNGAPLLKQLCDYILFNPAIWVHVDANVQQTLYTYLANEFVKKTRIFNAVRRIGTAIQVLHTLKHYYWLVNPMDRSGTVPRGLDGPRPSRDDMAILRAYLLLFLKQLILKEGGLKPDELQSILNYLLTVHEDDNLYDVLQLLVALMSESPSSVIPAFDQRSGMRVVFKLLASRSEHIRVQALKVLSYFLKHLSSKRKAEMMVAPSLFSLLGERLMLHTNVLSMTTYNVLFETLTEHVCTQVIHKQHPDADSSVKIQNPLILKVVATLLRSAPATIETMEVKRVFLSDMIRLFNNNRENRRSLLQCSVWQEWMFSLAYFSPRSTEERKITEMVFTLFRILLYHAVKYEWGGWRVWVDTLSIAHSKVSFEAHKERLARMYADFQRREQENGGPAEAAAGTVSTVSGLSDGAGLAKITELPGEDAADPYEGFPSSSQGADKAKRGSLLREVAQMGQAAAPPLEGGPPRGSADDAGTVAQDAGEAEATEEGEGQVETVEAQVETVEAQVETVEAQVESVEAKVETEAEAAEGEDKAKAEETEATAAEGEAEIEGEHKVKEEETKVDEEDITAEAETTAEEDVSEMETEEEAQVEVEAETEEANEDGDSQEEASEEAETSEGGVVQGEDEESAETAATEGAKRTEGAEAAAPGDQDDGPAGDATISGGEEEEAAEGKAAIAKSATPTDDDDQASEVSKEASQGGAARRDGPMNAGTQAATFRIPDFQWSSVHQRLLADILFALESDIHIWRSHTTKLLMDFVNSSENYVFVHNMLQITSHLVDNLIMVGGGLLPMLQAVTSPADVDLDASQHVDSLPSEIALNFLHRLLNLVDALVFASSLNFSEVESEKNMKAGGLLRQCLRLVCCVALRNCVESQEQQRSRAESGSESSTSSTAKGAAEPPPTVPARDPERLLQPMDVHRLRAVVFRDVEDTKQAQFLGLAVVYFISVLMVSKYRDILESGHGGRMRSLSAASQGGGAKPGEAKPAATGSVRRDNNERAAPEPAVAASSGDGSPSAGPDAMSELLSTLSTEVKRSDEVASVAAISMVEIPLDSTPMPSPVNGGKPFPPASHDAPATAAVASPLAHAEIKGEVGASGKEEGDKASELSSAPAPAPKDSAVGSTAGERSFNSRASDTQGICEDVNAARAFKPAAGSLPPPPPPRLGSITQRLERALESTAPLLREIFVDFSPYLSRTLLGSHGQELLLQGSGLASIKSSTSVVELVMLLCSQEWQNSIQKHAGLAFIELVNEGRILCHAMKEHLVRVGSEADFILERQRADEINKHAEFESHCAQYSADRREEEKLCHHMIGAARRRDGVMATRLHHRIVDILSKRHGAWGHVLQSRAREFWRLDSWEDDQRRRRRLVPNRQGSTHAEATLRPALETVSDEEVARRASRALRERMTDEELRSPETPSEGDAVDLSVDVEDEASGRSSPERGDWDLDTLTGPVALSTPAQLITPTVAFRGTLSITANELCFEVDEDDPGFKAVDPKVLAYTESLHGKWLFSEVEAIFSRRYLLQNTALEIFLSTRTSVMFNLPDATIVKSVVHLLPRVGIGTLYGLPQARRYSLASPRQLFKASNMTQRWQQRDVSNFEYLMFLNTIAGRTYNDLNQYPVFPWVIANYDSEELDLTLPSNFRDLSKPVGALNPQRAAVFAERYSSWDDADIPAFHYGTHYSTAAFVLMWLLRVEPFTNYFLSLQGGKFDHADRTFSSVARAWRNSQRDTSDVKELIPEFFYLPEMFTNSNDYNLGVTDAGVAVCDVVLPPWAKTGEEFVRINRAALESEIVSCQLHQWVDLIFGYKQRGPEAIRAMNVFYYLTYEGAVNMASIRDRVTREAVEAQIRSFGQTPAQLMVEPHAPRSSAMHMTPMMFSDKSQQEVIMVLKFPSNSPVTHVAANTGPMQSPPAILTITCSRLFAINKWNGLCSLERSSASMEDIMRLPVEIDPLLVANMGLHRRQIVDPVDHSVPTCVNTFTVTADNRFVMLGGFWDKSFRVYSTDTGRLKQAMFGHWDVVTCLARSEVGVGGDCFVASGSRDATVLLWSWSGRELALGDRTTHGNMRSPRAILTGHDTEVTSVAVSTELGLIISGSIGSPCLMHTLAGELLRALEGASATATPLLLAISQDALCFGYYDDGTLLSFSVNGRLSARTPTGDTTRAMVLSADGQYVLTGGDKGVVEVWRAYDLAKLYTYPMCDSSVRALGLSYDQRVVIAGMATGSIVLFHINFNHWHCEYQERYSAP
ncbi:unnamed protein product [Lampetra fluviatilis]